jgi:hypothetical protein
VKIPDFELLASLRADKLTSRTPPDARVDGTGVTLERQEARSGLSPRTEAGERYENVAIARRVLGELRRAR